MNKITLHRGLCATLVVLAAGCTRSSPSESPHAQLPSAQLPSGQKAFCVLKSPRLQVGTTQNLVLDGVTYTKTHQPDAPSAIELPISNPSAQPAGACHGADQYHFGSGIYDTTGPVGGNPTGHADFFGNVLPPQVPNGIHTRLYSRAFAIESPCNGKRVMFISQDLQATSALEHQEVLKQIAADPMLSHFYGVDNVMISGTHTHSAGGGFGLGVLPDLANTLPALINNAAIWLESLTISNPNFDSDNFNAIVNGMVQAIRRAHANLEAHPETARIKLSVGQLLNASVNRDAPAYQQDAPSERARFLDEAGHEVNVDKRFLQLNLVRNNGSVAGVINWFAVHPTSMANHDRLISSDNKGYAGLGFEKLMGTQYVPDAGGQASGIDNFVAAFAQTDEGDAVPDLFIFDKDMSGGNGPGQGVPYQFRAGTADPYDFDQPGYERGMQEATAVSGTKQLAQALRQFSQGNALSGPVDYRFFYADFSADEITDPVILAGLSYPDLPAAFYSAPKTTCKAGFGFSQLAGGVNGEDFGAAGYACVADAPSPYLDQIRNGYNGLYNGAGYIVAEPNGMPVKVPFNAVATYTVAIPVLCQVTQAQSGYACQNEKPVWTGSSSNPVPFQIFRIGNLAVLGVPWEVTTMGGRRLRKTVLNALSPVGVDTVVIAGLSNDYLEYMATREEYSAQMYEGASTIAGPWQLAAAQQEARKLALSMAAGQPAPAGVPAAVQTTGVTAPITVDSPAAFGSIVTDALPAYAQGDTVDVTFVSGYPGNDLKIMSSYLYAERQNDSGAWEAVATDRDPELTFLWNSNPNFVNTELNQSGASTVQAVWKIPLDTPAGIYRIRHDGVDRLSASQPPSPYQGFSSSFRINGTPADCP